MLGRYLLLDKSKHLYAMKFRDEVIYPNLTIKANNTIGIHAFRYKKDAVTLCKTLNEGNFSIILNGRSENEVNVKCTSFIVRRIKASNITHIGYCGTTIDSILSDRNLDNSIEFREMIVFPTKEEHDAFAEKYIIKEQINKNAIKVIA